MEQKKQCYVAPEVMVVTFKTENGFSASNPQSTDELGRWSHLTGDPWGDNHTTNNDDFGGWTSSSYTPWE